MLRVITMSFYLIFVACSCSKNSTTPPPPDTRVDTTSHSFVWQIDTLGEGDGWSFLSGVTILNQNDIWVVGELQMEDTFELDSLGNVIQPFSAAHWDGSSWNYIRIETTLIDGTRLPITPTRALLPIDETNFWIGAGSIFNWNGSDAEPVYRRDIGSDQFVTNFYNTNEHLFGFGTSGILLQDLESGWQTIPTNTALSITGMHSVYTEETGWQTYASISPSATEAGVRKIIRINGTELTEMSSIGLPLALTGLYVSKDGSSFCVGNGVYQAESLNEESQWNLALPGFNNHFFNAISGFSDNDIFAVGESGVVVHYNGATWNNYLGKELPMINGVLRKVAMSDDIVVAVGDVFEGASKGIVVMGRRLK